MSVNLYLTDEDADVQGYKRAIIDGKSDAYSLVEASTATATGPISPPGLPLYRRTSGPVLQWITDPLDGLTSLTASAWNLHLFAKESVLSSHAGLVFVVDLFRNGVESTQILSYTDPTELTASLIDRSLTTGVAAATTLQVLDRLVFKVYMIDAGGTMAPNQSVTFAYNGLYSQGAGDTYITCPDNISSMFSIPGAAVIQVRLNLKDESISNPFLSVVEVTQAINEAVKEYSRDRPRMVADYLSGDSSIYDHPVPRRWIRNFSSIQEIEYPYGNQYRSLVDTNEYDTIETVLDGQPVLVLRFITMTPTTGTNNILIRYSTRHVFNSSLNTIPFEDFDAVMKLAASHAAVMAAAKAASSLDDTLNADGVSYGQMKDRYLDIARELRKYYTNQVSSNDEPGPAGRIVDWDLKTSYRTDYIFHRARLR